MTFEAVYLICVGAVALFLAYKFRQVIGVIETLRKDLAKSDREKKELRDELKLTRDALSECRREHG